MGQGAPRAPRRSSMPAFRVDLPYGQMTMAPSRRRRRRRSQPQNSRAMSRSRRKQCRFHGGMGGRHRSGWPLRPYHGCAGFVVAGVSRMAFAVIQREAQILRPDVPHAVVPPPGRPKLIRHSSARSQASPGDWDRARLPRGGDRANPAQVGKGRVICGLSGGVASPLPRC